VVGWSALESVYKDVFLRPRPLPKIPHPSKPLVIGITLGEPAGIGAEVVQAALARCARNFPDVNFHILGSSSGSTLGRLTKKSGQLALEALEESVRLLKSGAIHAVVNAPVHKANLKKVGFKFPGQTEFYAHAFGLKPEGVTMMMVSRKLNVALLSTHCSLKEAIRRITVEGIVTHAGRLIEMLKVRGYKKPKIAICGLNPHAGEQGLFGNEELTKVQPAIAQLKKRGDAVISGPHSPDGVFAAALSGNYDGVFCLYHDQGLIPFKLVAFDEGVNLTWGLPFIRVSPDHGTALDLAGKGLASSLSMESALVMAVQLSRKSKS